MRAPILHVQADSRATEWRDITSDFQEKVSTSGLRVLWRAAGDRCEIRFTVDIEASTPWLVTDAYSSTASYAPWLPPAGPSGVLGMFSSTAPLGYGPARLWGRAIGLGTSSTGSVPAGNTVSGELWWPRPASEHLALPGTPVM